MKQATLWIGLLVLAFVIGACSASQTKVLSPVEVDLCKARAAFKLLEEVDQSLSPKAGSPRAEVERYEDAMCAFVPTAQPSADAGAE